MPSFNYGADGSDGLANSFKYYIDFLSKSLYKYLMDVIDQIMPLWNDRNPRVACRIPGLCSRPLPIETASFITFVAIS